MVIYSKEELNHIKTECYGCDELTSNMSGMCDKCVPKKQQQGKVVRTAHTLNQAFAIIERNG